MEKMENQVRVFTSFDDKGLVVAVESFSQACVGRVSDSDEAAASQSPAKLAGLCFMAVW